MFEKLRSVAPIWENLFWALSLGTLVLVLNVQSASVSWPLLAQQVIMIAAGIMLFSDVIDGAGIALRGKARWSLPSIMLGVAMGCWWGWAMSVMIWSPDSSADHGNITVHFLVWLGAGAVFGLVMLMVSGNDIAHPSRSACYDLDRPLTHTAAGRWLYFAIPIVGVLYVAAALIWPPSGGWDISTVWFTLLIIWTAAPLYPPRKGTWWRMPRLYGLGLALIAILAF